ncbi:hypothetical protein, partial [Staphylococcus pasteuri]|uniref:hypothetical protein n=1 Tax=Staphylococcus pasteuri TaxID=45972 RepID=UPI001C9A13DE
PQHKALHLVSHPVLPPTAPIKHPNTPIPTFLFLPPTPLPKTQLPKSLPPYHNLQYKQLLIPFKYIPQQIRNMNNNNNYLF